jgi:membrane protease subunit (stomatin/prohibitin family)
MGMAMAVGMGMAGAVVPAAVGQAAAQPVPDDAAAKLKKLKLLLDQQLITPAEYEAKKKEILAQL